MRITVITACYNSASTIGDTVESVLNQTCQDLEYVIVDGGSSDGTLDIIRHYEPEFGGRLKWISEQDQGLYDAMNKGLAMATGDVVGFLNSDDFFNSPNVLEHVQTAFIGGAIDAVYGDVHYCDSKDKTRTVRYYTSSCFKPGMLRIGFMPPHPSFYALRSVYQGLNGFDLSLTVSADFEMFLRLILIKGIRTEYLPLDFVTMRTGGISSSGWRSWTAGFKQRSKALRKNGVKYAFLFLPMGYALKIIHLILFKLGLLGK